MKASRGLLLLALFGAAACDPPKHTNMTGQKEHGMLNCPSKVKGAVTQMARTEDGVDLTVTATDPAAEREILTLARVHAAMSSPNPEKAQHSGQHGGPSAIGWCPVIHLDTVVSVEPIHGGARLHVAARSPLEVKALQDMTASRVAALRP